MPYSLSQSLEDRIHSSIASSLKNMTFPGSEPYIDCLVLHSPLPTIPETLAAWEAFSSYVPSSIHSLGISNTTLPILQSLYSSASIKPSVVQNRFYPETRWEVPLRKLCREHGIVFQTFWTLTGNPKLLASDVVKEMSEALTSVGLVDEKAVALYALVLGLEGTSILNGTTNEERMINDLDGLETVGRLIEGEWKEKWTEWLIGFKKLIRET
jgi:diketogulonate reductase-like aldo/keto reductase